MDINNMENPEADKGGESTRKERIAGFRRKVDTCYDLLESVSDKMKRGDMALRFQQQRISVGEVLKSRGLKPDDFLFWKVLIGSTLPESGIEDKPLDTVDGVIEKSLDGFV